MLEIRGLLCMDSTTVVGNHLLAEKQLAFASQCVCLLSSMQKSHTPSCPTITYGEALITELEYRKRLEIAHPHLLIALNGAHVLPKEVGTDSPSDLLKIRSTHDSNVPSPQLNFSLTTVRSQPANWYSKKKVIVRQPPSLSFQTPRQNLVPSFWCKICKVDCVTQFNFNSHIRGKKHKAKKLGILGNMYTGRPGSQIVGNTNTVPNGNVVSGSRNDEPNVISSSIAGQSSNVSSRSRIYGANENGCSAPLMNSLQPALQSDDSRNDWRLFTSERQIGMFSSRTTNGSSPNAAGPRNSRQDEIVHSSLSESSMSFAQRKDRLF